MNVMAAAFLTAAVCMANVLSTFLGSAFLGIDEVAVKE